MNIRPNYIKIIFHKEPQLNTYQTELFTSQDKSQAQFNQALNGHVLMSCKHSQSCVT